ncbi:glycosyltransferase family 2 protein [Phormidesmis priestleyi ULC007]|uniref:Glycosyltransferase family 2 protein n=1 Tax=Phormidesmis priestleyi ULC007 TaxID=1920490 RepID=A0A2T1DK81_9CYAN|nr:glycosyltransferase family 2 protein [Phormidesmis priestleyi]PSB20861.1 glycosyltransferase family 2 protein [Phormidesmis priestleyi ULC007]PZO51816.1 MAG: glycosyltransferase family 2 protein [Phormidesmis priestleyi]
MDLPAISIVIPTLNRGEFLQSTLSSLQSQTFDDWEAWVVDDGSTDDTCDRVSQIIKLDPRIHYIRRTEGKAGAPVCRNLGTQLAKGKYIIYLDSDDYLAVTALEKRFECMEAHPDLDFGVFPCILFKQQTNDMKVLLNIESDVNDLDRFLDFDAPWQTMCPTWRRESLIKLGLWDEDLRVFQDIELHFRAVAQGLNYRRFDYPDCFWRVLHDDRLSKSALSTSRLTSHSHFFEVTIATLKEKGLLTSERRAMLGGLYFFYTDYWSYCGDRAAAHTFWAECYDRHLINATVHRMGAFYATLSSTTQLPFALRRVLRRLLRTVFKLTWHPKLLVKTSKTCRSVPIEADRIPVVKLRSPSPIKGDRSVAEDRIVELGAQSRADSDSAENTVCIGLKANLYSFNNSD